MTAPFARVDVVPDSPEWLEERRRSLGASDLPAILGLSPHATPLDVYRAKFGVDAGMDDELAFIGHAEEFTIAKWLRRYHPELGQVRRGFMARSTEHPWLHASFDRFALHRLAVRRYLWTPVQAKTAHAFAGDAWEEGAPDAVQVQVQGELLVSGAPYGWAVGFVGGRRFHLYRIDRDEEFIRDLMLPAARAFWEGHVLAKVPPDPSTSAEAASLWAGDPDATLVADDALRRLLDDLRDAKATVSRADAYREALQLDVQKRMRDATRIVADDGTVLATWNPTAASEYTVHRKAGRRFILKPPRTADPGAFADLEGAVDAAF